MSVDISLVKRKLDNVGCGFCLAKWTQVTMHLHNGFTHSCHHPAPHKIPLHELDFNPTALHNTQFKKERRYEMLNGEKPSECDYCWKIENSSNSFSDRIFKSAESWSEPFYNEIKKSEWDANYVPKYVEVNFSNACNCKCSYCGPVFSSQWMEEIEEYGAYPTSTNFNDLTILRKNRELPYKSSEENPYIKSFWKWWPELYKNLHTFRITGGEPLLSTDTWKILDYILDTEEPNRQLNFSINTNLMVRKSTINKLVDKLEKMIAENRINEVIIFTSCDSWGAQAEYIRHGLSMDVFWTNIETILQRLPKVTINMMSTFNAMSIFGYDDLIDKVFELKEKYHNNERYWISAVQLDTSYLRWPLHQSVKILDDEQKEYILRSAKKTFYYAMPEFDRKYFGFSDTEVQKIKRTYDYAISNDKFDVNKNRRDFVKFVDEHDERRGTNFLGTFPEFEKLYNDVKNRKR